MNELVDALRNCSDLKPCDGCKYGMGEAEETCWFKMARDAADAIETLQAQVPAWISVEERLPELTEQIETYDYCVDYSKDVLIWSPMNMVPLFEIARYTDGMGWTDPYFRRIKFQETITHWMPLPNAPEVEE